MLAIELDRALHVRDVERDVVEPSRLKRRLFDFRRGPLNRFLGRSRALERRQGRAEPHEPSDKLPPRQPSPLEIVDKFRREIRKHRQFPPHVDWMQAAKLGP